MKKALEAAIVVAVLVLGGYVVRQVLARRDLALHPPSRAGMPAEDAEIPGDSPGPQKRGVDSVPMIKVTRSPRAPKHRAVVPPPSGL
ncbi:MAG: hypothetical protein ACHQ49_07005 [Elusimicrobiota bacterium]